jgi:catechol 2,3-dioxygenase-like lactoylglutathione lyase family enzyme
MKVLFVVGFGPISVDGSAAQHFYGDVLGLPLKDEGGYLHTGALDGVKEFAAWPLSQAAESCFGTPDWPKDVAVPQAWLEFDVDDLPAATRELEERGYKPLVKVRREPWGQEVTRLLGPEGILVGLSVTPSMRKEAAPTPA